MKSPFALTGSLSVSLYDGVKDPVIVEKLQNQQVYFRAVVPQWDMLSESERYFVAKELHLREIRMFQDIARSLGKGWVPGHTR